jgi:hypothetical protein
MESKVGGTSGAVYGIFFAAMAKAFEVITQFLDDLMNEQLRNRNLFVEIKDSDLSEDVLRWTYASKVGIEAVMKYGKAEPGDRTLVSFIIS